MTKIAIISDSHFDTSSRWEECLRIHRWIADDILKRGVDLVLHGGDVFERKSNPEERNAVAFWLREIAQHCAVVMVKGNHDSLGDLAIFSKLKTKYPIIVEEGQGIHQILTNTGVSVAVACLAWPRKANLLAALGDVSPEKAEETAGHALRDVLRGMGAQMRGLAGPKILLMHAMVRGSKVSSGQPLVGCDMEIGIEDLGLADADFYALGHIHCPNEWEWNSAPIVYPGSPRRTAYGEMEEKGYILAEFKQVFDKAEERMDKGLDPWEVSWERIPTPCTPMVLMDWTWKDGDFPGAEGDTPIQPAGCDIRFRYSVTSDQRDAAKAEVQRVAQSLRDRGAFAVKVEEVVIPQTRARTPEIATATTLSDKIKLLWAARNTMPDANRAGTLLAKLSTLEQEALDAT